ncbi:hypothetical protein [Mycobacterium sp. E796]|uniref:hypothetical protein n=1 Tax=Mycobacterium sp. E796 TaxID=1834151 RepID=UPI000A7D0394|nr:hypothetical protein [Mycobacterium sp. E796]
MSLSSVASAIGGGVAGSALTYGLTWFREQRRTVDAYRAPQRRAIGDIIAATNEMQLRADEIADLLDPAEVPNTKEQEAFVMSAFKAFIAAKLNLDRAFQIGKLTIADAECYEAMIVAYNEFVRLGDEFKRYSAAAEKDEEDHAHLLSEIRRYHSQLGDHVDDLVDLGHRRLSLKQSVWNRRKRARVSRRLNAKYSDEAAPQ